MTDIREKTARRWRPSAGTIGCLLVLLVLAVTLGPMVSKVWVTFRTERPDLARITYYTAITFPEGAKLLGSYSLGGQDRSIKAAVRIERRDAARFISDLSRTTKCEEYEKSEWSFGRSSNEHEWWDCDSARNIRLFYTKPRHPRAGQTRCEVLVRQDARDYAVIYLDGYFY